jgi:hypothetical protein
MQHATHTHTLHNDARHTTTLSTTPTRHRIPSSRPLMRHPAHPSRRRPPACLPACHLPPPPAHLTSTSITSSRLCTLSCMPPLLSAHENASVRPLSSLARLPAHRSTTPISFVSQHQECRHTTLDTATSSRDTQMTYRGSLQLRLAPRWPQNSLGAAIPC